MTLIENSTDFIGICDLQGMPFFVNRAGLAMVGLDSVEAAARTHIREFFLPEDQAMIMDEFFPSVVARGHGEIDVRFRHFRTGETRWMAYKVLRLTNPAGEPTAFATVSQDITERRQLEDSLRRWPRTCRPPIARRTNSSRRSPTNCAIRWPRSATCWRC